MIRPDSRQWADLWRSIILPGRLIIITGLLALTTGIQAQDTARNSLTLSLGPALQHRQDLIFSPFIHESFGFPTIGLSWQKDKAGHTWVEFQGGGFTSGLEAPFTYYTDGDEQEAYPHTFTYIHAGVGRGAYLSSGPKGRSILGASFHGDIQALDNQYGLVSFFGYYASFGVGAWFKRQMYLGPKHRLTWQVELPLVSWVSRSPYLVNDDEFIENIYSHNGFKTFFAYLADGRLTSVHELQRLNAAIAYNYILSPRFDIGATWTLRYMHYSEPVALNLLEQYFHVSAAWKW